MLTCQCALRAYVLTYLGCVHAYMPCMLRYQLSGVLTSSFANVPCVLTCQRTLCAFVLTCNVLCVLTCSCANMTCAGLKLIVSWLQNAIYFSIFTMPKKSHFTIFVTQNFVQNTKKHVNSIFILQIMFVR